MSELDREQSGGGFEGRVFYDRASAEDAITQLQALGYTRDDISVAAGDRERAQQFAEATGTKAAEGTATGGAIGGVLGAVIAALTATGSIAAIAGTGGAAAPLVVGPLAAALAGLGAGAVAGGVIGGLIGAGIPEERAREYEQGLNQGGLLVGVNPRTDQRADVRRILGPDGTPAGAVRGDVDATTTPAAIDYQDDIVPRRNV